VLFPTITFAIFFCVVFVASWALTPRPSLWKPAVLAASYVFYGAADWRFCFLLAFVTVVSQAAAVRLDRSVDERARRRTVAGAVGIVLLVLGVFKYYGFFVGDVGRVLDGVGLGLPLPLLTIALPVGISFYTFQAISYIVDVHRRLLHAAPAIDVAVYLSFFPQLVAGPIVRAREFLPQLESPRDPARIAVGAGVVLIAIGLVKKVAIADLLAREVVDPVFAVPEAYAAPDVALALYAYAAQIYCDFSGYTDIAIGVALLLGFVFPQNFNRPYRAASFREFWQRWHMTLSRFLRDYLYIPLGGNRGGRWRTARNLMITMLLGGLWHGAAWGFVLWGGLHGAYLVAEHLLRGRVRFEVPVLARWLVVFHAVVFAWVFFRASSIGDAFTVLSRLTVEGPATLWAAAPVLAVAVVMAFQWLPERPLDELRLRLEELRPVVLGAGLAVVVVAVQATVPTDGVPPFIYFRF
jgi:D-alanyl-lipoteichoic acid acyltransferase DltB (MBOAT superfamily)